MLCVTECMMPFCKLLKPGTPFHWDDKLNQLFKQSKSVILSEIKEGDHIFDKSKLTCLAMDRSKDGIGYWPLKTHCQCESQYASVPDNF